MPSDALLAALDEGDASVASESFISLDEARRAVRSWPTK
jgi:hypothetical protein